MPGRLFFTHDDLLRCRFAVSPLWETTAAVRLLGELGRHGYHPMRPFASRAAEGADLDPLPLLFPRPGYTPDFLSPPPLGPSAEMEHELEGLCDCPPSHVEEELRRCLSDPRRGFAPSLTEPLLRDPEATRDRIAEALRRAWELLVRPHWSRLSALLEADISYRARSVVEHGLARVIADLDPSVRWRGDVLSIPEPAEGERRLDGHGLVLMPSAFVWPETVMKTNEPWPPTLIYPVNGVARLWNPSARADDALARLLGDTRARVLEILAEPTTTTVMARTHPWSAATVSEHLSVLRDAGLVHSWRVGRRVFYTRTPLGDALVLGRTPPAGGGV